MKIILLIYITLIGCFASDKELKDIFEKYNIKGTIVIEKLNNHKSYIYDVKKALTQYIPASTFKIPHTLIVLEENIIKDEYEIIPWDGVTRGYPAWNRNQNLQTAITYSCVWCYELFTKKIKKEKYLDYLKKIDYGNRKVGSRLSKFWLEGDVKISAVEQVEFLQRLYRNQLPFKQQNIDILKKILVVDKTENYTIRAKSGWSGKIGWYIGYIEKNDSVWFFAFNSILDRNQLKYRKQIVFDALKVKNIL